ncbi:MAG: TonB family protein [Prevotella sp.]|nr:TonB family protein [Prevotella sp.]
MKLRSYKLLFRLFSFLSDKTNGASFFVKYKLLLGTVIISLVSSSACKSKKEIVCYDVTIEPDVTQMTCYDTITIKEQPLLDNIKVKGAIKDINNEPLPGANIRLKGKEEATTTDSNGKFSLKATINDTLSISYIGFIAQNIPVSKLKDNSSIVMEESGDIISCYIVETAESPKKKSLLKSISPIPAVLEQEVKGVVTDEKAEPLFGASILIKGTNRGVITDEKGQFTLKVKPTDTLVFSYIGFSSLEKNASEIESNKPIILEEVATVLCYEVMVVESKSRSPKLTKLFYNQVEQPPVSPVGDLDKFNKWIEENVLYTKSMQKEKIQGQLILSFTIDEKGNIIDKAVLSKLSPDADAEALRVLSSSEKWTPGMHDGKAIKTIITIPVQFRLKK